jgi:hypothetical protein
MSQTNTLYMTDGDLLKLWRGLGKSERKRLLILFEMRGLKPNGPAPASAAATAPRKPPRDSRKDPVAKPDESEEKQRQATASLSDLFSGAYGL